MSQFSSKFDPHLAKTSQLLTKKKMQKEKNNKQQTHEYKRILINYPFVLSRDKILFFCNITDRQSVNSRINYIHFTRINVGSLVQINNNPLIIVLPLYYLL